MAFGCLVGRFHSERYFFLWGPVYYSVQLVNITPITMVYDMQITIIFIGFIIQLSYRVGAPHCIRLGILAFSKWVLQFVGEVGPGCGRLNAGFMVHTGIYIYWYIYIYIYHLVI